MGAGRGSSWCLWSSEAARLWLPEGAAQGRATSEAASQAGGRPAPAVVGLAK